MLASRSVISIIVPTHAEPSPSAVRFADLRSRGFEVVVVDSGSTAESRRAFERSASRVLSLPGSSRGVRQNAGAEAATGEILIFLHADSALPEDARRLVEGAVRDGAKAGSFRLAYEKGPASLKWIAFWANLRTRFLHLPFGDQGLFCTRDLFLASRGFADLPICDDLDFVLRLKKRTRLAVLPGACVTSPRRYAGRAVRQVFKTWFTILAYFAGVPAARLERWYRS